MTIRRFIPEDAEEVSALITRTLREVNIKDYTAEYLEKIVQRNRPEDVLERARSAEKSPCTRSHSQPLSAMAWPMTTAAALSEKPSFFSASHCVFLLICSSK